MGLQPCVDGGARPCSYFFFFLGTSCNKGGGPGHQVRGSLFAVSSGHMWVGVRKDGKVCGTQGGGGDKATSQQHNHHGNWHHVAGLVAWSAKGWGGSPGPNAAREISS